MTLRFKRLLRACALGLALAAPAASHAAWPETPITLIVPWAAGGSTDILARVLSEGLTQSLGQSVIVENRSGASGNIGTTFCRPRQARTATPSLVGSSGARHDEPGRSIPACPSMA